MRAAKRTTLGRESAIGWVDLTVDGAVSSEPAVATAREVAVQLAGHPDHGSPPAVFSLPPSARQVLWETLNRCDHPKTISAAVERWAHRLGHQGVGLPTVDEAGVAALRADVMRARWWPAAAEEGTR